MKRNRHIFNQIPLTADLPTEVMPAVPLIEIAGYQRVLIERHCGVIEYGRCKISVRVSYGIVSVLGTALELQQMSKEQLIITGTINSILIAK